MDVQVPWSDQDVIVALKPAGVPAQPDKTGDLDLLTALQRQFDDPNIGIVHRLDRPVSGVMLFGRNAMAVSALNAQFREQRISKVYWAIVHGEFTGIRTFKNTLVHDAKARKARIAEVSIPDEVAEIHVTGLVKGDRYSLVRVVPTGGAFHQIRAQLSAAGHSIKGDVKYGARRGEKDRSIALHARSISFNHPNTDQRITCYAPTPDSILWKAFVERIPEGDQMI